MIRFSLYASMNRTSYYQQANAEIVIVRILGQQDIDRAFLDWQVLAAHPRHLSNAPFAPIVSAKRSAPQSGNPTLRKISSRDGSRRR